MMPLYNRKKAVLFLFLYFAFLGCGAVLTIISSSGPLPLAYQLGKIFGTAGLTGLTLQLWLGARAKFLDKGIGLDKILKFHSFNARLTFSLIILHPVMLFAPAIFTGFSLVQILSFFTWRHYLGVFALLAILATIITTVYQAKIKINYEHWKIIHKIGYLAVILGFAHGFFIGSDILSRAPLYYWWLFLAIFAVLAIAYRYIVRPQILKDSLYSVVDIVKETKDVYSIYFKPIKGEIFNYYPGQFAFVKFYSKNLSAEEHHFTLSSSPTDNKLCFTIKESGDFTSQIKNLTVGDTARIEGPFGVFSNFGQKGPFLFIAGGIGITPLMSMLRYMRTKNVKEKVTLIYACKTRDDLAFYNELEKLKKSVNWFKVIYVLSNENYENKSAGFYKGQVSEEILSKFILSSRPLKVFLVGPQPMMHAVQKLLKKLEINKKYIFTEKFALK